jgi:H+/Cl- antiporter ClcA
MTNDHAMVIPLMAAAAIASLASRVVCEEGVYHALSKNFLPRQRPETTERH